MQDAIKEETRAFEHYVREPSQESSQTFADACAAAEESLAALPFDYAKIGEDRYARTWSLRQGYAGYQKARDAFLQLAPSAEDHIQNTAPAPPAETAATTPTRFPIPTRVAVGTISV